MRSIIALTLILSSILSFGQNKIFTISEAISGYHLYPRGVYQFQWLPDDSRYSILESNDSGELALMIYDITGDEKQEVNLANLQTANDESKDLKRFPAVRWINGNEFRYHAGEAFYAYDINTGETRKMFTSENSSGLEFSPTNDGYAETIEHGISGRMGTLRFKREEDAEGIVMGQSVHRNEFGITKGLFWAPSGKSLAYYYMDESMVTEYPLYNLSDTPATATMLRYPTAGAASHHVTVKVFHQDKSTVVIKTEGPADQFLTNVSWTPDSKHVLIAIVNREQNHMWLNMYDAVTGDFVKTILEEENEKYVEPEHTALFLENDPTQFVWWSERDGYNHLYLYDINGQMIRQLTKGEWVVTAFHGFSKDGKDLFITSTAESPTERHLYCVNVRSGKMKKLTTEPGYHSVVPNSDFSYFMDDYSSVDVPRKVNIIDLKGKVVKELKSADNPLSEYKLADIELGVLKGKSGDDLHYRLFKPVDFDPNKKYPVVVYLYNGPHAQMVTNRWLGGANMWYHYMAQNGYAVFTIDGRGSAYRGFEFESAIFRNCAAAEMEDQLTGVEWLKSHSWVDADRLGIHGWSYGGFMTTSMMSRNPGVFKVGVAGGPVIDWSLYEVMYTERYMDTPEENPDGYAATNLKNYIKDLDGKLLMIHGGQDDVVLWQHSLQYLQQAIKLGVQLDYFVYPHHKHNVLGPDRVHLYDKVSNYFFDNL